MSEGKAVSRHEPTQMGKLMGEKTVAGFTARRGEAADGVGKGSTVLSASPFNVSQLEKWSREGKPHPGYVSTVRGTYHKPSFFTRINNLALDISGTGFYTTYPEGKSEKDYDENNDPKKIVDAFMQHVDADSIMLKQAGSILVFGFCPTELIPDKKLKYKDEEITGVTKEVPAPGGMKLLLPESVRYKPDDGGKGKVVGYAQGSGRLRADWEPWEMMWLEYSFIPTDHYGSSLVQVVQELEGIQSQTLSDMKQIIKKYWKLLLIWMTDDEETATVVKETLDALGPDEDPILSGAIGKLEVKDIKIDPRIRFWEFVTMVDDMISDELQAASLSKFKSATEASATKMEDIIARWAQGVQRALKRAWERLVIRPLVLANGFTLEDCPRIEFGLERSGVEDISVSDVAQLAHLSTGPVLSPKQARDLLRQMGIPVEEDETNPDEDPEDEPDPEDDDEEDNPDDEDPRNTKPPKKRDPVLG